MYSKRPLSLALVYTRVLICNRLGLSDRMAILNFLENLKNQGNWYMLSFLATFVVMLLYSLFYAVAHAFNLENTKRNAKSEVLQAIATLLILMVLVTFIDEVDKFTITEFLGKNSFVMCGGDKLKTEDITHTYEIVGCRLEEHAKALATLQDNILIRDVSDTLKAYMALLSTMVYAIGIQVLNLGWIKSWYDYVELARLLLVFSTPALVAVNTLIILVNYISANMLTIFLPVGLILRAFHFTRGIGAFFMAIGIGFYFIFPVLFVLSDPGFQPISEQPGAPSTTYKKPSCYPTFSGVATVAASVSSESAIEVSVASSAFSIGTIQKFYSYMIIHLFAIFSITLIIVRYMMTILGGEAYTIMRFIAKTV